nr:Plug domain-containing protein [uncultured Flavobacterium sp.]
MHAQVPKTTPDIEKLYLHTDNSKYFIGDNLYYKAYNLHASNNLLFDNSNILYVELISSDSKIIARNKTNLEMGLGNGDFQLADSLDVKPGVYQIRAYTNWNRNFGDDFVFKKNIEIINVFEAHTNTNKDQNKTKEKKAIIPIQSSFRIDFFPEGGSLLENVTSVIGFKAVDSRGNPIDVKGEVFDSDNELITSFASPHDGMGKFQMIPIVGKHYYAKIKTLAGEELRAELPKISKEGYLLSFRVFRGKNIISITTNPETLSHNPKMALTMVCKTKGISYLETVQTLTEITLSFELPKVKTPEGISQITLYDSNSKPQSERLVYIEKEHDLEVQLMTDKVNYKPEEKTTINITSKSKTGEAKSASFSLSVTDMNGMLENEDYGTNISSYFLMESDIRGKVYNPAYYFNTANLKRLEHLDDLLLTQGWRDFVWKTAPKASDSLYYKVEKGITISGRVKQLFGKNPLVNNNMTLALMGTKNHNFFTAITDSIGCFKFENLMFSGKASMYLSTRDVKGKFRGEIFLDSIEQAPMVIPIKKEPFSLPEKTSALVENVYKKFTAFGVKPENILKEVEIIAKNKRFVPILYGVPDYSYKPDENTKTFTNIYDVLEKVPGVLVVNRGVSIPGEHGGPLILIDGYPILEESELYMVSPSEVEKIDVIRGSQVAMLYITDGESTGGAISILTNGKRNNKPKKEVYHSIKKEIDGFYTARIFYSENPEQTELNNKVAVRNTIYWNPYVHPDATGNATVNYYNSSVETKVKVALEGVTGSGIPVVKKAYYVIKK